MPFTTDPQAVSNFVATVKASGGDDFPEDLVIT